MTPLSASERAAITAAERAGKVQRLPAPCAFWGGRFERLPFGGVELQGEPERRRLQFGRVPRQVARGKLT